MNLTSRALIGLAIGGIVAVLFTASGSAQCRPDNDDIGRYPIYDYEEPRVGTIPDAAEWAKVDDGLNLTWASRDVHYSLHSVPKVLHQTHATISAWRGERANIVALIYSKRDEGTLRVQMSEWRRDGEPTGIRSSMARFVNYVITDDYKACGDHPTSLEGWLVPDVIDLDKPRHISAMQTRPVWCSIEVPRDIAPGEYECELQAIDEEGLVVASIQLTIAVNRHTLPEVSQQRFHLDLWQQPYAISRYHGVERWSDDHIEALRPYLQALGRAGQSVISAILFYEPWGMQTHEPDRFEPMVQTIKSKEGTWRYDYTIFDRYVTLCAECGISRQISCFSMVPWDMSFRYYDEATADYKYLITKTSDAEYRELWNSFLASFKAHLTAKGWFEKTYIAMDERSEEDMHNAYNIAVSYGFKVALAGNYHASLIDKLNDFSIAYGQLDYLRASELRHRQEAGYTTTFYTCCADVEPNIYSNSLPAEAAFIPIYAAALNLDGYLHWSWVNWDEAPLMDSRYRLFGAGDTYFYYPGNRSSVRFERLIEGIQQYEKIFTLREEFKENPENLALLDAMLQDVALSTGTGTECATIVNDIEHFLNGGYVE